MANFLMAIGDIIAVPHGILAFFLPTRTYLLCKQFNEIHEDARGNNTWRSEIHDENGLNYNISYRICAVYNFWIGLLDLIVLIGMAVNV